VIYEPRADRAEALSIGATRILPSSPILASPESNARPSADGRSPVVNGCRTAFPACLVLRFANAPMPMRRNGEHNLRWLERRNQLPEHTNRSFEISCALRKAHGTLRAPVRILVFHGTLRATCAGNQREFTCGGAGLYVRSLYPYRSCRKYQ
jgi:hypothetical protein